MANLTVVVNALKKEEQRAQQQIEQLDAALAALGSLNSRGRGRGKGHKMSTVARRKIASAQRARWARVRAGFGS
jgi:hypothetical protein